MSNFLTFKYWFNLRPEGLVLSSLYALVAFLAVLLIVYIVLKIYKQRFPRGLYFKLANRLSSFCSNNIVIGLFLMFFAFEAVPLLSMRLWFLIWALSMVAWLAFILRDLRKIPEIREKLAKEKEFKRYIP